MIFPEKSRSVQQHLKLFLKVFPENLNLAKKTLQNYKLFLKVYLENLNRFLKDTSTLEVAVLSEKQPRKSKSDTTTLKVISLKILSLPKRH